MDNVTLIRVVSGLLAFGIFLPLYFLPAFLARKKRQFPLILLLNIFLGWTLLGWVGALLWAVADQAKEPAATSCSNCGKYTPPLSQFCSGCGHSLSPDVVLRR
jgi:hypothetical protein